MSLVSPPSNAAEDRRRAPSPPYLGAPLGAKTVGAVVPAPAVRRWRAFALLVVAYFMTIVDLTIVNVALPTIGRKLHFPEHDLQWVVTAYGLTFGGVLLLGGRAADLLGRPRLLMVGLAVFSAASLACGLATSCTFLIVMRGIQGTGAAIVLPAALSIVMDMFPEGAERNKALGIWGAVGAMGATVGLLAGGLLTSYIGWQYIFFLNVPIGAAALALATKVVPDSKVATWRRRYDPFGAVSITSALVVLVYAISEAPQVGWGATRTVAMLTLAAALLGAFFVTEARGGLLSCRCACPARAPWPAPTPLASCSPGASTPTWPWTTPTRALRYLVSTAGLRPVE
jgi:MFS family permease